MKFSSHDRDNDLSSGNCVHSYGGWWYRTCSVVRLNDDYNHRYTIFLNGHWHALPFMEIKIRPLNCNKQ